MNLVKSFLTHNPCYTANVQKADSRYTTFQQRGPLGLMLHSVGCAQPSAQVFINNWNSASYTNSCVHGIIDANTGTVYQCLPWNYRGWHGAGSCNNTHVGVEMCESGYIKYDNPNDYSKFSITNKEKAQADCKRCYDAAVELFASICKEYGLNPLTDIVSHYEGGRKGIASGHGDPEHYWRGLGMSYTMDGFRADVKKAMTPPAPAHHPFEDVQDGKFYSDAVQWGWLHGLVEGKDETHYCPNNPITRGEAITLLKRFYDEFGGG